MKKYSGHIFTSLALSLLFSAAAFAQVTGGALTGSVVDPNGAAVPSATVIVRDNARNQQYTATTTSAGSYQFPNLPVGNYSLTVTASGFTEIKREVNVSLNQTTTVDFALTVAGAAGVVDVVATGEAVVQSDSSQLSRTFEERKVQDLPINGNPNNLALLAPNVVPDGVGVAGSGAVSGGIRTRGNTFNLDGIDNNDASVTGPATAPIQDAVSEFTLLQNNFNAEFGAGAGGQYNIITKSGTNQFHGSVFTYVDSQRFNARSTDEDGRDKDFFKQARYGFTVGGPLPYPHFGEGGPIFHSGRDKLFFFVAAERQYLEQEASTGSFLAPTLAGLNQLAAQPGVSPFVVDIFRNFVALAPNANFFSGVTLIDPDRPELGFVVPVEQSLGLTGVPFGDVVLPIPAFQEQNAYQFNFDHLPNERNQFRYRYSRARFLAEQAGSGGLGFNNNVTFDSDLFSFNYIKTLSANFINDFRFSYFRTITDFPLLNPEFNDFPNLTVNDLNLVVGPAGNLPQSGYDNNYQAYNSITFLTGPHTFKFGADVRRYIGGSDFLPRARGDYAYATLGELLRDDRPTVRNIVGVGSGAFVSNNHRFFFFGQDDWKIRPNLTLNLGLRYEFQGLYRDAALQATASPANVPGVIEFGVPETDKNNFAPRLGFAYAPNWDNTVGRFLFGDAGKSAIRFNYARSFFPNFSNFALISLPPTLQGEITNQGPLNNFLASGGAGGPFIPDLRPQVLRGRAGSFILSQIVPYSDSITVSYQRQIGNDNGLEVRYLRTRAKDLPVQVQLNSPEVFDQAFIIPTYLAQPSAADLAGSPSIASILAANPTITPTGSGFTARRQLQDLGFLGGLTGFPAIGESRYDGIAVSFNRRFTKNFGFTTAYTFSRTEDNSTNELNTSALNPRRAQDAGEFFGEGLDLSNEFSVSVLDIPHRFVTSFNVDIPWFNDSDNGFLRAVLGGFQINGIFQVQSGQPITVLAGRDFNVNQDAAGDRALFNPAGDPTIGSGIYAVDITGTRLQREVSPGVFVDVLNDPRTVAYVAINGDAGFISTGFFAQEFVGDSISGLQVAERNSFRTNGSSNTDLVVLKNTRFGNDGRFNFQIGAEIFDLFNQRQRTIAGVGAFTSAFAIPGNPFFNDYSIGNFAGRNVRLRAKFIF